jgi:uncharacterized flavoprotein (TIGR03862 family)
MKIVAIIGGGPSALMLAAMLDEKKYHIHIYEKNAAVGRKFLVAGDGGFNLTHSESIESFIMRYTPHEFLEESLRSFTNLDLCDWLKSIGIETYTGSSKRIFPVKGIKPIEVLNAFLAKMKEKNVRVHTLHKWQGWNETNQLIFQNKKKEIVVDADITVFALGGASWTVTGSDGAWLNIFKKKGIQILPFQASNCAYNVQWPDGFLNKNEGQWLKNISVSTEDLVKNGELVITKFGLEGGAVYALSPLLRKQIRTNGVAKINIDFKSTFSQEELIQKLSIKTTKSITQLLSAELKLTDTQIALLKTFVSKEDFLNIEKLTSLIKTFPVSLNGTAPIDEVISTVGGIALGEVDKNFQLNKLPNYYVLGEMLDWDAPTGGYLLQGCFSMAAWLAKGLNELNK